MFYAIEKLQGSMCDDDKKLFCFDTKRLRDMWVKDAQYSGYAKWITCTREVVAAKDARSMANIDDFGDRYCYVPFHGGVVYL